MMKEIASLIVLLVLCIPAMAIDMPDMVGNWTGTFNDVSWLKNTDFRASGKPDYLDNAYTITIEEQNGTRFAGRIALNRNPLTSEVLLGVIASNNEITLVDEDGYLWGFMKSPTEIELFYQAVDIDYMKMGGGTFTKE